MSLVYAALVPHPPMLLPSIGREHAKMIEKTWVAYQTVSAALNASKPEIIVVITPHQPMMPETFAVNFSPTYSTHFMEFGDFSPAKSFVTDAKLVERIRHEARRAGNRVMLMNEEHLDYGTGVPLFFLPGDSARVVPISPTLGSGKAQFAFGQALKEVILHARERIAVICSGDFSHRHTSDSPLGFTARASEFDEMLKTNLAAGSASPILQMDEALVTEAHACGYRPVCMLMGILDRMEYKPELLCYEAPFGVGYCTMQFKLN